jgi:hypothetical protein
VLDIAGKEDIFGVFEDEKQMRRAEFNFLCEFLSELKDVVKYADDFVNTLTICSNDKLVDFFTNVKGNVEKEKTRLSALEKVEKSHKKTTKKKESSKKVTEKQEKSVK